MRAKVYELLHAESQQPGADAQDISRKRAEPIAERENTKILKSPSDPLSPRRLRRLANDLVTRYRANPDGLRGHVGRALAIAISG